MSDVNVVALVPVAGRAGVGAAVLRLAVRKLIAAASVDRVILLPESELDFSVSAVLDAGDVRVVSGSSVSGYAAVVAAQPGVRVVLVHDPLRAHAPVDVVDRVVHAVLAGGRPVVPVLPCSDTVKRVDDAGVVMDTPDRAWLRVLQSPIGYPAGLISSGAVVAGDVPAGALLVAGDPKARRVVSAVDLVMIDGGLA